MTNDIARIAVMGLAVFPVRELANAVPLWAAAVASSERVLDLLRPERTEQVAETDSAAGLVEDAPNAELADLPGGVPVVDLMVASAVLRVAPGDLLGRTHR